METLFIREKRPVVFEKERQQLIIHDVHEDWGNILEPRQ